MNGGKRAHPRPNKISNDLEENQCPNASKRMKRTEMAPSKPTELVLDNREPTLALQLDNISTKSGGSSDIDEGLDTINEDDSYITEEQSICNETSPQTKSRTKNKCTDQGSPSLKMVTPEDKMGDFILSKRQSHTKGNNYFSRLSDEMLLMIFQWLPKHTLCNSAVVCKRWRRIAYDDSLWTRLDLGTRVLRPRNLEHVLKRGVTTLRLANVQLSDPVIKFKSSHLPPNFVSKLQYLDLTMAQISPTGLYELLHTCRNLRKLSLENCTLSQQACEAVGHNASLDALNLSSCEGLTSNGLEAILACCTSIVSLNLSWTHMEPETLETLTTTLPKSIQRLNIAGCRKNLNDEHVKKIVNACPNLVEFDLSDCTIISGETVSYIACNLESLEHLSLSRCYAIQPGEFEKLNESYSLVYLDVFGVMTEALLSVVRLSLPAIYINKFLFSSIARPTVGVRRTSIWGLRVRD